MHIFLIFYSSIPDSFYTQLYLYTCVSAVKSEVKRDLKRVLAPTRQINKRRGKRGVIRGRQLPHGAVPRARRCGHAFVPGMGAGRGRLVSHRRHCAWFHFDFACGQLQWLGLRSCRFHVGAGAFGAWLCLWEITRVFGRTTWYRLLLLPSTCWRPVTWWKGVRFGFRFGWVRTVAGLAAF